MHWLEVKRQYQESLGRGHEIMENRTFRGSKQHVHDSECGQPSVRVHIVGKDPEHSTAVTTQTLVTVSNNDAKGIAC